MPISGTGMRTLRNITHFTWAAKQLADVELMGLGYYQPDLDFNPEVKEFISLSLPIPLSWALGIPSAYSGRWCKIFHRSLIPVPRVSYFVLMLICHFWYVLAYRVGLLIHGKWRCELEHAAGILNRRALCECGVDQALSLQPAQSCDGKPILGLL